MIYYQHVTKGQPGLSFFSLFKHYTGIVQNHPRKEKFYHRRKGKEDVRACHSSMLSTSTTSVKVHN